MKKVLLALCCIFLIGISIGCTQQDAEDVWTQNVYPATNNTYTIGSPTLQYQNGYFVNLTIGNMVITNFSAMSGNCVYIWDADNSDYFSLCHDGGVGIIENPTGAIYIRADNNVVADLTGDSAGMYEFQVENSGNHEVASIDTAGNLDVEGYIANLNASISATGNVTANYFYGDGSNLTGIEQGELILYFLNGSSPDIAGQKRLSSNYNSSTIVILASGLSSGNTLMGTWITDAGVPSKNLLTGNIRVHVTGRQTAGTKISQYFFELWKCNSSGSNLTKIATSEYSNPLTAVNVAYRIWTLADEVELNTSDRIKIIGYVFVSGGGSAPTVEAQIQGPSFTRLVLPVGAVSVEKFVPYTGAVDNLVSTYNITASQFIGNGSQLTGITSVYHNEIKQYNTIIWTNSSVTSSGIATFYPTDDGTSGGTALFTNIYSVQALATANTTTATEYPFSSLKSISVDKKTIQVNVGTGDTLLLGGATIINAVDNTQVYITVIGD